MSSWKSVDDVLNFAIKEEEAAVVFYRRMAANAANEAMREAFEQFAREEEGHKRKLQAVMEGRSLLLPSQRVVDMKITDYMVDVELRDDLSYAEALVVAAKKEKAAFRLYTSLASMADELELKALFEALAQEEARHKLRFEIEYDDFTIQAES